MEFLKDFATVAFLFVLLVLPLAVDMYLKKHDLKPPHFDWN